MPKPNAFLEKQRKEKLHCIRAGMDTAWQEMWDLISIALHDPDVMGKDTFGKERLTKLKKAVAELENVFYVAMGTSAEADYYQEKMDSLLREIYGDELAPFKDRYPNIPQLDYTKQHRQWKDLF